MRSRIQIASSFVLVALVLGIMGLFAFSADTTYSTFNVQAQAYQALRLKDNTDSTYSYQTWVTGDGTHYQPSGDLPTRAISTIGGYPGTFVVGTSTGGAQANSPTLPAVASKTNYCGGFTITGLGASAGSGLAVSLSDGTNTLNYTFPVVSGVTTGATPLNVAFNPPLPASAVNTAWTLTVPSFGSGNTAASANIYGYVR